MAFIDDGGVIERSDFPAAQEGGEMPPESQQQEQEQQQQQQQSPVDLLRSFAEDYHNIAEDMEEGELNVIGQRVLREYEIDESSRSEWKAKYKIAMSLARQVSEEKNYPWPKAANVKYPLITTAAVQFNARAYPAIVVGRNIVKGKVIGSDKGTQAKNPQTGQPEFEIDPQTGQPMMGPDGQPMVKWEVPPGAKQSKADRVAAHMNYQLLEEMVEWEEGTDKLLLALPIAGSMFRKVRYDQVLRRNVSTVCMPLDVTINQGAESLDRTPRITYRFELYPHEIEERRRKAVFLDKTFGMSTKAGDDDDAPHEFLEQCRYLDLDKDGFVEPYTVTVHKESGEVVRIEARFEPDGIEQAPDGSIMGIKPIQYYIKYGFLPDPDGGFYDIGFGMLLGPINETINTTLNAMLDAGHLQNVGGGFIRQDIRVGGMSKAALKFRPGEFKGIETGANSLRDSVYSIPFGGPSPVLFQLLGLLIEAGRDIASVKDVLTGETGGKVIQPTALMAMIEQGLTVFTAIYKRVHRSVKAELKMLYELNARYLPQEVYFRVLDEEQAVSKQDYASGDSDVIPVSDPKEVSDMQRMARAEFLMGFRGDPFVNQKEIRDRVLNAAQLDSIEKLLVDPPVPQPDPMIIAEIQEKGARLGMDMDKAIAENIERGARAIKAIADAEAVEAGPQIEIYKAQLDDINRRQKLYAAQAQALAPGNRAPPPGGIQGQGLAGGGPVGAGIPPRVGEGPGQTNQ